MRRVLASRKKDIAFATLPGCKMLSLKRGMEQIDMRKAQCFCPGDRQKMLDLLNQRGEVDLFKRKIRAFAGKIKGHSPACPSSCCESLSPTLFVWAVCPDCSEPAPATLQKTYTTCTTPDLATRPLGILMVVVMAREKMVFF